MKKYITVAALFAAGSVFANAATPTDVSGSITLDGTQATDARLDFMYSTYAAETLTTTIDSVTIYGTDGYGLGTENTSLTFNIKYELTATNNIKLVKAGSTATWAVNTNLNDSELSTFASGNFVSRWVVNADIIENIGSFVTNDKIDLSLGNVSELADGGLVFFNTANSSYYAASDISFSGNYASVNSDAIALELEKGTLYTVAKITAGSGASVKGIGFVASIPEPSAFGVLAGLGALVLVGTRRRR